MDHSFGVFIEIHLYENQPLGKVEPNRFFQRSKENQPLGKVEPNQPLGKSEQNINKNS